MDIAIRVEGITKEYRLGTIGSNLLTNDFQSWWHTKILKKEDPNQTVGDERNPGYSTFKALDQVNVIIKKGESLGIIGANGAGKSTLLKIMSRITAPTQGKIYIQGKVSSMLEVGTGFHPDMTGRENIYMNGAILGMERSEIDQKIEQIIDFSECRKFIDTPVKRYSSGMYVKLAFAVSAHLDSDILIVDEVLAVGDVNFQAKCIAKMNEIISSENRTIICVSHNVDTIRKLCKKCLVLERGKALFYGDTEESIIAYLKSAARLAAGNSEQYQMMIKMAATKADAKNRTKHIYDLRDTLVFYDEEGREKFCVQDLEFAKKDASASKAEPLIFILRWRTHYQHKSYRLRIFILRSDLSLVGVSMSDSFKSKKTGVNETTFVLNTSFLAGDDYSFRFDIDSDISGNYRTYEIVQTVGTNISFHIVNTSKDTYWDLSNWGNVNLPDTRILEV